MLAACPRFESGPTEWTEGGTNRHRYLHLLYKSDCTIPNRKEIDAEKNALADKMSDEEIEACHWAYDYIKLTAALNDHAIHFERKMSATLPDFSTIEGTPDVVCGHDLFDLKWRERDYGAQMAAYALMMFEENPKLEYVRVHIMFGAFKRIAPVYSLTQDQAEKIVMDTIASTKPQTNVTDVNGMTRVVVHTPPEPRACDYCGWCKHNLTCAAITGPAKQVAVGYGDGKPPEITSWHPSEMKTPEQIAFGLTIWRKILKKWGESMEFHALEAAKNGTSLPGFELKPTTGRKYITDVPQAFQLSGLSQEEFISCCEPRIETSKTYPDKKGLVQIFAVKEGMKQAPAKRALLAKLEPVIKAGKDGYKLAEIKGGDSDEENS